MVGAAPLPSSSAAACWGHREVCLQQLWWSWWGYPELWPHLSLHWSGRPAENTHISQWWLKEQHSFLSIALERTELYSKNVCLHCCVPDTQTTLYLGLWILVSKTGRSQFDNICQFGDGSHWGLSGLGQFLLTGSGARHQQFGVLHQSLGCL